MVLCYLYMKSHGFSWLLAFDSGEFFVPTTQKSLDSGQGSFINILGSIFSDYNPFEERMYGYMAYLAFWGLLGTNIGVDLYYTLQVSTLFVFPFAGLLLNRLLLRYGIDKKSSFNYSIIICVFSIIFFYSSQILRDTHILVFYLIAIEISTREKLKITNIFLLVFIIIITSLFRLESGLFLIVSIPVYLLSTLKGKKNYLSIVLLSLIFLFILGFLFLRYMNPLLSVANSTYNGYIASVQGSGGVIALLQSIPLIGDILSIFYNTFQPIPFWRCLSPTNNSLFEAEAAYNILNITRAPASFLNCMTTVYLLNWLFSESKRKKLSNIIKTPLRYQMFVGLIFLYIQSAVIDQRRIMGYYCVFYVAFLLIYHNTSRELRSSLNIITLALFLALQVLGLFY